MKQKMFLIQKKARNNSKSTKNSGTCDIKITEHGATEWLLRVRLDINIKTFEEVII